MGRGLISGGEACNRNASLLDGIPFAYAVDEPVSGGGGYNWDFTIITKASVNSILMLDPQKVLSLRFSRRCFLFQPVPALEKN